MKFTLYAAYLLLSSSALTAAEYPFADLPETITATFDVNTQESEAANNKLLGYNIFGFSKPPEQALIRKFDPITIRFPHGVWSNFYNWETDGYTRNNDPWESNHADVVEAYIEHDMRCGFPGLAVLHEEKKKKDGRGYDMIWTYNLNYDSPQKSVARLKDRERHGFEVQDIELGNEHFWKGQRSTATSTPEKSLKVAQSVSAALKEDKSSVRLSIPLSWRRDHTDYNKTVADDQNHFDAISIHKYTNADPDKPEQSNAVYRSILTARLEMEEDVNFVRSFAPGKPVWMTEWGVSAGPTCRAGAALAMADCYLFLFANQDVYERANWFSVNGTSNSFLIFKERRQLQYPLKKTSYASTYEIIRSVFEHSQLLDGKMVTNQLKTERGSIDAVSARAVSKDGKTTVLAVNLTDRPCRFVLKFDSKPYEKPRVHEAMVFSDLSEVVVRDIDDSPLTLVENTDGMITLPPLSVSRISGIATLP